MGRRIAILIQHLFTGGEERKTVMLAEGLAALGHEPHVITFLAGGELSARLESRGVRVTCLQGRGRVARVIALMQLLQREQPDIVQTHMFPAGTWGRLAAIGAGCPAPRVHIHSTQEFKKHRWKRLWPERVLARFSHCIVGVADSVEAHLREVGGFDMRRYRTIPNGVDTQHFQRGFRALGHPVRLVATGRLDPVKGFDVLLRAIAVLRGRGCPVVCEIVGEGPWRRELETLRAGLGLEAVVALPGLMSDVREVLERADVYVCASHREGLSLSVLEALAMSLPVVATDVGGNSTLLGCGCGWLVPPNHPEALAEAVQGVLADPEEARRRGQLARERAEQFSLEAMVAAHVRLYEDCLEGPLAQ